MFVPAVIEPAAATAVPVRPAQRRARQPRADGMVKLEIDGVAVKIGRGEDRARCGCRCPRRGDRRLEGIALIGPGSDARVMVATMPVDFRKGADSLTALVKAQYGANPFSGVVYVFRAKKAVRMQLVWWDGTGHRHARGRGTAPSASCRLPPL